MSTWYTGVVFAELFTQLPGFGELASNVFPVMAISLCWPTPGLPSAATTASQFLPLKFEMTLRKILMFSMLVAPGRLFDCTQIAFPYDHSGQPDDAVEPSKTIFSIVMFEALTT